MENGLLAGCRGFPLFRQNLHDISLKSINAELIYYVLFSKFVYSTFNINYLSNSHISCSQKKNILRGRFPFAHVKSGKLVIGEFSLNAFLVWGGCCSTVADVAITALWNYIFGWLSCSFSCSTFCFKFSLSWENTWFWILGACGMWCWKRWFSILSMIFLHITRFPQTSFEDNVVWFSFLNSIFINIWPRCWWHGNAHFSTLFSFDFQSGFFGNFSFSLC